LVLHAEGRLLDIEGTRSRGDQHKVTYSTAGLDQVNPGQPVSMRTRFQPSLSAARSPHTRHRDPQRVGAM